MYFSGGPSLNPLYLPLPLTDNLPPSPGELTFKLHFPAIFIAMKMLCSIASLLWPNSRYLCSLLRISATAPHSSGLPAPTLGPSLHSLLPIEQSRVTFRNKYIRPYHPPASKPPMHLESLLPLQHNPALSSPSSLPQLSSSPSCSQKSSPVDLLLIAHRGYFWLPWVRRPSRLLWHRTWSMASIAFLPCNSFTSLSSISPH